MRGAEGHRLSGRGLPQRAAERLISTTGSKSFYNPDCRTINRQNAWIRKKLDSSAAALAFQGFRRIARASFFLDRLLL